MATLIITIQEHHQDTDENHKSVGFSILNGYDGELRAGDCLPGLEPLLVRAVRQAIDSVFGPSVASSNESIEDAQMQIENRHKRFMN
jgi:hypothetical protein